MEDRIYDLIIIGAGPAGLSAGIYAGRAGLKSLIIEQGLDGGQIAQTAEIENYPGQGAEAESGVDLVARFSQQAERFACDRAQDLVQAVNLSGDIKEVKGLMASYRSRSLVLATGASPRKAGFKGEAEFTGRGVSYCASCDGNFFKGSEVYVVGGGDAAVTEAVFLSKIAGKVTLIHRRDSFRAAASLVKRARAIENISFIYDSVVEEAWGTDLLEGIRIKNLKSGEKRILEREGERLMGLFVAVGFAPNTALFQGQLDLVNGYIVTDEDMATGLNGVFAAGDLRQKNFRQVITAAADGAIAANSAAIYLLGL